MSETDTPNNSRIPAYRQIEEELRCQILNGTLACGTRLPNVLALAKQYSTSVFTIQSALAPLAREGLIISAPRRGTTVLGGKGKLSTVGLYFCGDYLNGRGNRDFYRRLHEEILKELSLEKTIVRTWIDTREESFQGEPIPELLDSIENHGIQALIACCVNPQDVKWLSKLNIPISVSSTGPFNSRIGQDSHQMFQVALRQLRERGCRSVGLIIPRPIWGPKESDRMQDIVGLFPKFLDAVRDEGLEIRNEWVRTPEGRLMDDELEEFGYRQFLELWKQPQRPEGLIIYPDTVVRGAITGILQAGVSVPNDLKLVLHRNENVPLICPLPASWIVTSVRQWAVALIEQIQNQIENRHVQPVYLPVSLNPEIVENNP
jgi:DNA-binding LacI/PurR family transcriptional regulator